MVWQKVAWSRVWSRNACQPRTTRSLGASGSEVLRAGREEGEGLVKDPFSEVFPEAVRSSGRWLPSGRAAIVAVSTVRGGTMGDETTGTGRRGRAAAEPEGDGPEADFARRLWGLKQRAGNPSYDVMRRDLGALASKSALSAAGRGVSLPSWDTTWEFVRPLAVGVLGQDEQRVHREWRRRWDNANAAVLAAASADGCPPASPWFKRHGWLLAGTAIVIALVGVLTTAQWPRPEGSTPATTTQPWPEEATPATIAEPCEETWLCLYRNIGFDDMNFRTQRHNTCWRLADYHLQDAVFSYDNNLPVAAHFYDSTKRRVGVVRAGDSSQDSSVLPGAFWFCTGSARP